MLLITLIHNNIEFDYNILLYFNRWVAKNSSPYPPFSPVSNTSWSSTASENIILPIISPNRSLPSPNNSLPLVSIRKILSKWWSILSSPSRELRQWYGTASDSAGTNSLSVSNTIALQKNSNRVTALQIVIQIPSLKTSSKI